MSPNRPDRHPPLPSGRFKRQPSNSHVQLDLTDEECEALTAYLRKGLDAEKFWLSPKLDPIKSVLAKLAPAPTRPMEPPTRTYAPPRVSPKQRRAPRT